MADTPPDSLPISPATGGPGAYRIAQIKLDEATILWRNADVEQERRVAIYDLIEENTFKPLRSAERGARGPYHLHLSVNDGRLAMDISDEGGQLLETLLIGTRGRGRAQTPEDHLIAMKSIFLAFGGTLEELKTIQ